MRGLGLHDNLAGAEFVEEVATAPKYRMHSIGDVHPGMYEVETGGASIVGELYNLPIDVLLHVIEGEPPGLHRGPVTLADGRIVPGILFDADLAKDHPDISQHRDWRVYMASK
jgi:AGZA family xanthine/uracil permease-like MFS transporter